MRTESLEVPPRCCVKWFIHKRMYFDNVCLFLKENSFHDMETGNFKCPLHYTMAAFPLAVTTYVNAVFLQLVVIL